MPKYVMEEFGAQEKGAILVISFFSEIGKEIPSMENLEQFNLYMETSEKR